MICLASRYNSDSEGDGELEVRGGSPDLASSPDVLICMRILRGTVRFADSALFNALAVFSEEIVCTVCRFGNATIDGLG